MLCNDLRLASDKSHTSKRPMNSHATDHRTGRSAYRHRYGFFQPDWRWQLADAAVPLTPLTKLPDCTCWHLAEFLQGDTHWCTDPQSSYRFSLLPLLEICQNRRKRLTLEARILACRNADHAAELCGLDSQTVRSYCLVFFDVLDRLEAPRAIEMQVLRDSSHAHDTVRRELYRQAYFAGPAVAEHWLEHLPFLGGDHDFSTQAGTDRATLELAIAARELRPEGFAPQSLAAYARLVAKRPLSRPFADQLGAYTEHALASFLTAGFAARETNPDENAAEEATRTANAILLAAA